MAKDTSIEEYLSDSEQKKYWEQKDWWITLATDLKNVALKISSFKCLMPYFWRKKTNPNARIEIFVLVKNWKEK